MLIDKDYMMLRTIDLKCSPHINSEMEIIYVRHGGLEITYDDKKLTLTDNEAAIVLPYRLHCFEPSADADALVYMFSYSIAEDFYNKYKVKNISENKFTIKKEVREYICHATGLWSKSDNIFAVKSLFYAFLSEYPEKDDKQVYNNASVTVRDIIDCLSSYNYDNITLADISSKLNMNKAAVSNIFKNYTGMRFNDFVNNVRVERAKSFLLEGDLSIAEIAYQCGFGSIRSFNRAFLKNIRCTPTEYKKRYNKK